MPSSATFLFPDTFRFYISVNVLPPLQKNYSHNQINAEFIRSLKYSFTHFIIQFAIKAGNKFQESESSNFYFITLILISTYLPCTFIRPAPVVQSRPKLMRCKSRTFLSAEIAPLNNFPGNKFFTFLWAFFWDKSCDGSFFFTLKLLICPGKWLRQWATYWLIKTPITAASLFLKGPTGKMGGTGYQWVWW